MSFWQKNIMYLKKVGPQRAEVLAKECNIRTYGDLLHYYPRKYVDRTKVVKVRELQAEGYVTLVGKIYAVESVTTKRGRGRLTAVFKDSSGTLELNWFRAVNWLKKSLRTNEEVAIFGKVSLFNGHPSMSHPEIDYLEGDQTNRLNIVPSYPSTEKLGRLGLDSRGFRQLTAQLLLEPGFHLQENLPAYLLERYRLMGREAALRQLHYPETFSHLEQARRRLKFEELFFFQLMLAKRRSQRVHANEAPPFPTVGEKFHTFYNDYLPFSLTNAQKRVLKEIRKDMGASQQMNRLVQGDVGSGKTMVAFMSMLIAIDNGYQAALMAPTEILAEQHFRKLSDYAEPLGLTVALLVGGQRKAHRRNVLEKLASGEAHITVGTHALIEDPVVFHKLGMVVVDEQHKFGVKQRARLWQKGRPFPHNLIMTATPIPRTLAMTLYGDVDVSIIDELPPGRKPIKTVWRGESRRLEVWGFIKKELQRGKQAYVVYPLVEESEKLDYLAAVEGKEKLENYFSEYRVGMVHGRMKPEDKEIEMQLFLQNKLNMLVSTTVIEVGVDVPNSTVMVIENAEKFGLSQLHQLRGRVGRNDEQSYCILMSGPKVSNQGKARLQAMVDTNDGFQIADTDLQLRGPGDFLGTRQSGLPEFQLANIAEDQAILQEARKAAFAIFEADPAFEHDEHAMLAQYEQAFSHRYNTLA
ncbi:MAG: ATP-dependent DNA helicase RecG [Bacteroidota bacterium]